MKVGTESYSSLDTHLRVKHQSHECEIWSAGVILGQFLMQKLHLFHEVKVNNTEQKGDYKFIVFFIMELCVIFGRKAV